MDEGKILSSDFFRDYLGQELLGKTVSDSYLIGNSICFVFKDVSIEIHASWRFLNSKQVTVGSADIGWEETAWSEEEKRVIELIRRIISGLVYSKLNKLKVGPFNDVYFRFDDGVEFQNFHSSTSKSGNITVRDDRDRTKLIVSGNNITRAKIKTFGAPDGKPKRSKI